MKPRLLKRDYNQELEEIAESKRFEKEAQNLLLSMLYKVEGAYDDYETVKREVPSKEKFLENILYIVKEYCKEIVIAKPNTELEKELSLSRCKILEEEPENNYNKEQKVIFFPNEKVVLYSIIKAGIENIKSNLSIEDKAMLTAIQIGKCIAYSEVIRDFNGFSWSIVSNEIESIECNLIYTDLIYLLGEEVVSNINSSNIKKIKNSIDEELYKEMQKIALKFYLEYDKKQKEILYSELEKDKIKFKNMEKQQEFIENISNNKKHKLKRIKEIDEMLNNSEMLRKEYIETNSKLSNEQKVFSISHYEEKIQKERNQLLQEIEECNKYQNPIEFVKIKNDLKNKIDYYKNLQDTDITNMQKEFLRCFSKKLETLSEKQEILSYIYKIRYLKFLDIDNNQKMKDVISFENVEKAAISKGIAKELITPISNNIDTDYNLLKSIFETKNISLDELLIGLKAKDGKLISEIYDGDILDSTNYIILPAGSNVQIRKTKKVKIFN